MASVSRAFSKARHGVRQLIKSPTGKKASKGNVFIVFLYSTTFPQLKVLKQMFLVQVVNFHLRFLKTKWIGGSECFWLTKWKFWNFFLISCSTWLSPKCQISLWPIESKFEGSKGNERRTGEAFFPNKAVPVLWPRAPSKILQSSFHLEKLVLVNHFPRETAFRMKTFSAIKSYGGKECVPFRPFFLPQQAVVSKARAQWWWQWYR